jgi:probable F420-dependent oxidoreductase
VRFGVQLPNYGRIAGPEAITRTARLAEALGYHAVWTNDHLLVPSRIARYGRIFESLTTLVWAAACTERVTLGTSVLILPLRDPILTAKQLATIDVLSRGRLIVGAGAGYVAEEFGFLGAPFERRGDVLEERIGVMRALWRGATAHQGVEAGFGDARFGPLPVHGDAVPLWLAGASRPAMRRAARLADAWHPAHLDPPTLAEKAAEVRRLAGERRVAITLKLRISLREGDRAPAPPPAGEWELRGGPQAVAEDVARLREAGLEELVLTFRHDDERELAEEMEAFAGEVVTRFPEEDRA